MAFTGVSEVGVTETRFRVVFLSVVLSVWVIVVGVSLYGYLAKSGPMPDAILLGVPTGTWLAVYPPLPRTLREEPTSATTG